MTDASEKKIKLKLRDVEAAFRQAQDELGSQWQLTGHGHSRRVSLRSHHSRAAFKGAQESCGYLADAIGHKHVFPYELVVRAAEILNVPDSELRGARDEQSETYRASPQTTVEVDTVPAANPRWQRPLAEGKRR